MCVLSWQPAPVRRTRDIGNKSGGGEGGRWSFVHQIMYDIKPPNRFHISTCVHECRKKAHAGTLLYAFRIKRAVMVLTWLRLVVRIKKETLLGTSRYMICQDASSYAYYVCMHSRVETKLGVSQSCMHAQWAFGRMLLREVPREIGTRDFGEVFYMGQNTCSRGKGH